MAGFPLKSRRAAATVAGLVAGRRGGTPHARRGTVATLVAGWEADLLQRRGGEGGKPLEGVLEGPERTARDKSREEARHDWPDATEHGWKVPLLSVARRPCRHLGDGRRPIGGSSTDCQSCPIPRPTSTRSIAAPPSAISTASLFDSTCQSSRTHIGANEVLRPPFPRSVARPFSRVTPALTVQSRAKRRTRCVE